MPFAWRQPFRLPPNHLSPSGLNRFGLVHSTDDDDDGARARGTPRALLRICPLQSSPDPGLVEAMVARLQYSRSGSAAGPSVNCDWLSRRLNILILGAVPFAEQGWGERRWRSGVNGARALFSTGISWIALRERSGNSRTLSSEFCGTNTLPPFRGQVARQARLG